MKYKLLNKSVLKLSNSEKLINSLTTNNLDKPVNAFLDRFGKLIAYFHQVKIGDDFYIILEANYKEALLNHLEKYLKLSKVKIEELSLNVIHYLGNNLPKGIAIRESIGNYYLLESLNELKNVKELTDEEYLLLRLENNIPLQGVDFTNEMFLEVNLLNSISFTKGCYLGQEIIARVNSRSKPVKKLVRIALEDNKELEGEVTSKAYSEKYKKTLAFVMAKNYEKLISL